MVTKYSVKSRQSVKGGVHNYKQSKSGKSRKTVKNPKRAVAVGHSAARKKGTKIPAKSKPGRK